MCSGQGQLLQMPFTVVLTVVFPSHLRTIVHPGIWGTPVFEAVDTCSYLIRLGRAFAIYCTCWCSVCQTVENRPDLTMKDAFLVCVSGCFRCSVVALKYALKAVHWAPFGTLSHAVPLWLSQIFSSAPGSGSVVI